MVLHGEWENIMTWGSSSVRKTLGVSKEAGACGRGEAVVDGSLS